MALFTAILEYKGGNYTSQVRAVSAIAAYRRWIRTLDQHGIERVGKRQRQLATDELSADRGRFAMLVPVQLEGLRNVWYCPLPNVLRARGAILNLVKTAPEDGVRPNTSFESRRSTSAAQLGR